MIERVLRKILWWYAVAMFWMMVLALIVAGFQRYSDVLSPFAAGVVTSLAAVPIFMGVMEGLGSLGKKIGGDTWGTRFAIIGMGVVSPLCVAYLYGFLQDFFMSFV
ncbi:hypothetical protein N9Z13_06975 [Luminiphilus sp.]|nr:hypothetical protein [Luminiphilus sp.]